MILTTSLPVGAPCLTAPLLLMVMLTIPVAHAEQPPGWKWYNDPLLIKEKALTPPPTAPSVTVTRTLSPTQQIQWFHRYHDDTKN
ncbi:type-F conjugative transfer system pilin assembly protein TraF, partial [Photobacterium frigidiphilum]